LYIKSHYLIFVYFQDEVNQVLTTNVWLEQVNTNTEEHMTLTLPTLT